MADLKIAFWNLQNLFDTTRSDIAEDFEFTPEKGWTEAAYKQKIKNLAEVIKLLHNGQGPDLLGICEIENLAVIKDLVNELAPLNFNIAHADSPDLRGIDSSLIYSPEVFELIQDGTPNPVPHALHLRYPTRDIFEVRLRVKANGAELIVMVNHWPSRSMGTYESEPLRIAVAEYCGNIVDGYLKFSRSEYEAIPDDAAAAATINARFDRNILLMGDFNDEPLSRSMLENLRAARDRDKLEERPVRKNKTAVGDYLKRRVYLHNCMWRLLGEPDRGTYFYSDSTNTMNMLDQFVISPGLLYGRQALKMDLESVDIPRPPVMTTAKGRPVAYDKVQQHGYSDHFPIEAIIKTV